MRMLRGICGSEPCSRPAMLCSKRDREQSSLLQLVVLFLLFLPGSASANGFMDLWLTPDQQGQRLFNAKNYPEAAEAFEDPARRAASYYRGGDFESAAALYGVVNTPEAAYNRGNALIMLGRYDEAIASFERSLQMKPGWPEAQQNLDIARVRRERLQPSDDDAGGTGGQLEADEIVFDDTGRVNKSGSEVTTEGGEGMSDTEMRAVWLRRVQSDPADFLRARFSYQLYRDSTEAGDEPDVE